MAIRHSVKMENSLAKGFAGYINSNYETMTFQHLKLSRNVGDKEYTSNIYKTEFVKNNLNKLRICHFVKTLTILYLKRIEL